MLSEFSPSEGMTLWPQGLPGDDPGRSLLPETASGLTALAPLPALDSIRNTGDNLEAAALWSTAALAEGSDTEGLQVAAALADPLLGEDPLVAIWQSAQESLTDFLRSPDSTAALALTFGAAGTQPETRLLIQQVIQAKGLPQLTVLPEAQLTSPGAYAANTNTIFLAKELFGQPEKLLRVFLEELGHFLDRQVNPVDSPGDEGALFAAQVLKDDLSPEQVAAWQAEDDTATLQIAGQWLTVEQNGEPGAFTVDASGQITVEFQADGGAYEGQLAVFSLTGMAGLVPGSPDFIREAARRALSNSAEGYIVINDLTEGAALTGALGERDRNRGERVGRKTFTFAPDTAIALMLVPNGRIQTVFNNPAVQGNLRPLFSLASANPNGQSYLAQLKPGVYAMEDVQFDSGSDGDFNDIIFTLQGATGQVESVQNLVRNRQIWLESPLGRQLFLLLEDPGSDVGGTPGVTPPIVTDPPNPTLPPLDLNNLQVAILDAVPKFTATSSEAEIIASGAASLTFGTQRIYIGTNQVASNNQNPIVASFDSANPANNWVRTDYEVTGTDGRGLGLAGDGSNLYGVFSVDGTQGAPAEDFRRAADDAEQTWLRSYGQGGGAKVAVLGRIDPQTGELLDAAYLSAILSNGNSNTLTITNLSINTSGNLVVSAQSFFSPRRPNGTALNQVVSGSSPFSYTVEITPNLKRVVSTSAVGWA